MRYYILRTNVKSETTTHKLLNGYNFKINNLNAERLISDAKDEEIFYLLYNISEKRFVEQGLIRSVESNDSCEVEESTKETVAEEEYEDRELTDEEFYELVDEVYEDYSEAAEKINAGLARHFQLLDQEGVQTEVEGKKEKRQPRKLKTAEALMAKDIPDPKIFVGVGSELPLLVEGTCILSAKPKLGKSWFALAMCLAVARGEDFLGYKTEKSSTLYLDLETSESIQKKRLLKALQGQDVPKNFYLETETEAIGDGFIEQIEAYMKEDPSIGVVVIDVFGYRYGIIGDLLNKLLKIYKRIRRKK